MTYKQNFEEISITDENLAFKTFNELADFNQFKADNKLFYGLFYCYFALSCQEIKLLMLKSRGLPIISAGCLIFRRLRERSESFVRIRYFCFPNLANLRQVTRPTMNQISILDSCLSLSTPSFNNC